MVYAVPSTGSAAYVLIAEYIQAGFQQEYTSVRLIARVAGIVWPAQPFKRPILHPSSCTIADAIRSLEAAIA